MAPNEVGGQLERERRDDRSKNGRRAAQQENDEALDRYVHAENGRWVDIARPVRIKSACEPGEKGAQQPGGSFIKDWVYAGRGSAVLIGTDGTASITEARATKKPHHASDDDHQQ